MSKHIVTIVLILYPVLAIYVCVPPLIKAYKTNRLPGRGTEYDRYERPFMFWGMSFFYILMIVFPIVTCVGLLPSQLASPSNPSPSTRIR